MTSVAQDRSAVLSEIGLDKQTKAPLGVLLASGNAEKGAQ
jgi:hypothetical protein